MDGEAISQELAAMAKRIQELMEAQSFGEHIATGCLYCRANSIRERLEELRELVAP